MTEPPGVSNPWETMPKDGGPDGLMVLRPAVWRRIVAGLVVYLLPFLLFWVVVLAWFPEPNGSWSVLLWVFWGAMAVGSGTGSSGTWSLISADHIAGSGLGWGRDEPHTRVVMHEDMESITVRQSVIDRLAGVGTIDIDCREGKGPRPVSTIRWRTPHSFSIIYVRRPHAAARRIWEKVTAHIESIGRPGPQATLHL